MLCRNGFSHGAGARQSSALSKGATSRLLSDEVRLVPTNGGGTVDGIVRVDVTPPDLPSLTLASESGIPAQVGGAEAGRGGDHRAIAIPRHETLYAAETPGREHPLALRSLARRPETLAIAQGSGRVGSEVLCFVDVQPVVDRLRLMPSCSAARFL